MKLYPALLFGLVLTGVLFVGCYTSGGDGGGGGFRSSTQFAVIALSLQRHLPPEYFRDTSYTSVYGVVIGNPLPGVNSYAVGDSLFRESQFGLGFSRFFHSYDGIAMQPYNLDVTLNTTNGMLAARILRPDTIRAITLQNGDSIMPRDTDLHIGWSGSNADYYFCTLQYYIDEKGVYDITIDTLIQGNELVLPGSMMRENGVVFVQQIASINGSYPYGNTIGNLSGSGSGWALYSNFTSTLHGWIAVGRAPFNKTLRNTSIKSPAERFREQLQRDAINPPASPSEKYFHTSSAPTPPPAARIVVCNLSAEYGDLAPRAISASGFTYGWSANDIARFQVNDSVYSAPCNSIYRNQFSNYYSYGVLTPWAKFGLATVDYINRPLHLDSIALPDLITQVNYPVQTSIPAGQSLTVSWAPVRANFCKFMLIRWVNQTGYAYDTTTTDTSITFPGTMFTGCTRVDIQGPTPVNGPPPRAGVWAPDYNGVATFLYYENRLREWGRSYQISTGTP